MATEIPCDYCGKPVRAKPFQLLAKRLGVRHSITCSRQCAFAIRRGRPNLKLRKRLELICDQCGKTFVETQVHAQERRFCSIECKAEFQKSAMRGENNPFFGRKHDPATIERIKETRVDQFGDKNPNWRGGVTELKKLIRKSKKYHQWRDAVYKRDGYRSVQSGKRGHSRELVAHHIPYLPSAIRVRQ